MESLPFCHVDAFTAVRFRGNPAVVCVTPKPPDESLMRQVAAEMNVSETAFLSPIDDTAFSLRWYTPLVEVDLCGHATLASAHVLWEDGHVPRGVGVRFQTRSGELRAERLPGEGDWIELDFPSQPPRPAAAPEGLFEALGIRAAEAVVARETKYAVVLESEEAVRALRPDYGRLGQLPVRGLIATARGAGHGKPDFISRYFGPAVGINEDPVTGSAHCILAPYWAERLGTHELLAYQASQRGGSLRLRLTGDRVRIAGQAVTVTRGRLVG
jgi:PhzF family phenazine biosynthesis protein